MGTADLRLGDAFKLLLIGAGVGAVGMYLLGNIKAVQFQGQRAQAYPSQFWDLRDPGASPSFGPNEDYAENSIPREGLFVAPDPDFGTPNFSEAYGPSPYQAPKTL